MVPVIDCQVHAYDRDRPERPWAGNLVGPASATGDEMVAAMDAVGVDGALLPFEDIWDPLARAFDAFGLERCLWGTDWTRAVELLTYREGVQAFASWTASRPRTGPC